MRIVRALTALIAFAGLVACTSAPIVYVPPPFDPADMAHGNFQPNAFLYKCANYRVTNSPPARSDGLIKDFAPIIVVNDKIVMASIPVNDVCLSSGFGQRNGRLHKGLDLQHWPPGDIYSAAPGKIRELTYSSTYGNMIVIEHGYGVFTRYAHLAGVEPDLAVGQEIGFGRVLGLMGKTGRASGVHLHFEILTGRYTSAKKSFGLTPRSPFEFPAYLLQDSVG